MCQAHGCSACSPALPTTSIRRVDPCHAWDLARSPQRIIDAFQMDQCLIFCRTNFDCDNLEKFLNSLGGFFSFSRLGSPWVRVRCRCQGCCGPATDGDGVHNLLEKFQFLTAWLGQQCGFRLG